MKSLDLANKPAEINREPGGSFTLFGAYIVGRQIELVPNQRIVQAWRVMNWDPGVYSIASFELTEHGSGTRLVFDHTGFPAGDGESLAEGWKGHYWESLAKYLD
jgi:activator of HSP90 ATPase